MMRALVALLAVTSVIGEEQSMDAAAAPAKEPAPDTATCALDSARAVDDIMDGMVYIMASIYRCDPNVGDKARCALDVSAAIEAVNRMVNVIVKAVDKCGQITTDKPQCGLAISELTRSMAALTSASSGIVVKCPNDYNGGNPLSTVGEAMEGASASAGANPAGGALGLDPSFGQCVISIKDSVKSLFKAVKRVMVISDDCAAPDSDECAHNSIKVVDAFVGLAEFISGAVAKCGVDPKNKANAGCAQMSARLTHAVGAVGVAGTALAAACEPTDAERLYLDGLDQKKDMAAPASSGLTMGLTALLPITAVVAFVAGKRLASARSVQPLPNADEEMLVQDE